MEKKKKLIILGIIALTLVIIGTTYAILTWTSTKINLGLTSGCFTIDYTKGQDISGNLKLLNESDLISNNKFTIKNGIGISAVNIGIKSTCTIEGFGSIYLNITNISEAFTTGDSKGSLKYAVLNNNSTVTTPSSVTVSSLLNQSFDIVSSGSVTSSDTITLITKQLSNTEIYKYLVVIYVDNSLVGNSITSAAFNGNISADAEQVSPTPEYCFTLSNKDETNKTASISGYNCYEGNSSNYLTITSLSIPEKIDDYTITSIENFAFNNKGLTSIIMPDTITSIKGLAFANNKLTKLKLSNSLTLLEQACSIYAYGECRAYDGPFSNNELIYIEIPKSLTVINDSAFKGNSLTSIIIPSTVTKIDSAAFWNNKLTNVIIPNSVTSIGNRAFSNNQLTNVIIPDSVTIIGSYAFFKNQLVNVTIPDSVTSIGDEVFSDNQLTNVTIPDSVTTIGNSAFTNNKLTNVILGNSITTIGYNAFKNNQLTDIIIPDSVTTIGDNAFKNNQLTDIIIPDSVTTIGNSTFESNNLNYVLINSNSKLTSIGFEAFSSSNSTNTSDGIVYVDNPNLKIYNNSGKAFDWNNAVNSSRGTTFVTGTTNAKTSGSVTYNAVTVTTGQPS